MSRDELSPISNTLRETINFTKEVKLWQSESVYLRLAAMHLA